MTDAERDLLFKLHLEEIQTLIAKRRHKWRATSIMEWEDVASQLLTRCFRQLHHYDTTKPLDRWVNKLISHAMMNMLRDNVFKLAAPCTSGQAPGFSTGSSYGRGCACYLGAGRCAWTKSGVPDTTCSFYASWLQKKHTKFAISTPLSIENHVDEYHSTQDDFLDIEAAKKVIDENIKKRLTKEEYRVYIYLYVKHLSMEETMKKLGFKKNDQKNYMRVRNISILIKETAKAIVSEQSLVR